MSGERETQREDVLPSIEVKNEPDDSVFLRQIHMKRLPVSFSSAHYFTSLLP